MKWLSVVGGVFLYNNKQLLRWKFINVIVRFTLHTVLKQSGVFLHGEACKLDGAHNSELEKVSFSSMRS